MRLAAYGGGEAFSQDSTIGIERTSYVASVGTRYNPTQETLRFGNSNRYTFPHRPK
jgi:hypothetical protein